MVKMFAANSVGFCYKNNNKADAVGPIGFKQSNYIHIEVRFQIYWLRSISQSHPRESQRLPLEKTSSKYITTMMKKIDYMRTTRGYGTEPMKEKKDKSKVKLVS